MGLLDIKLQEYHMWSFPIIGKMHFRRDHGSDGLLGVSSKTMVGFSCGEDAVEIREERGIS